MYMYIIYIIYIQVAREYGIPAIVGSKDATVKFKTGDIVTIDTTIHSVTRVQQQVE